MRQRIRTLDGLRFLAALGVLWIHSWTIHKNPRFYIWKIDVANFLAIGVNGVDLFFVISGFCMYYFYGSKPEFSFQDFYGFLIKRWLRLSPAFYFATIVYILVRIFGYHQKIDFILYFIHSLFYLNIILNQYTTSPHFWTLTAEWQFYFIIPVLVMYQNKIGFKNVFIGIFGCIFILAVSSVFIFKDQFDLLTATIFYRGLEFGCGIIAARLLIKNISFFKNNRALWFLMFLIITYSGRVLISKPVLDLSHNYYNFFKLIGFSVMGVGFAGILYLSVTSVNRLDKILGNKLFISIGRISFSFYLWHYLVFPIVASFTVKYLPFFKGIAAPMVTTILSAIILYPISLLSYNYLEKPFLKLGNLTNKRPIKLNLNND